jgi:transcriptional regulator with XRE-family HTH domain
MSSNEDVRSFLKSRRARIDPDTAGFHSGGRRRVAGLRREEVAALANVSIDYYTQLEQGRDLRPSASVLAAISDALRLDVSERSYLTRLTRADESTEGAGGLRAGLLDLVGGIRTQGAFILDQRMNVLAINRIADALLGGAISAGDHDWNLARYVFEDPRAVVTHPDWEDVAESMVATLRYGVTRWHDDTALDELLQHLHRSDRFVVLWEKHDVAANASGTKRFQIGGRIIDVRYEVLIPPTDPNLRLTVYTAQEGSPAREAFAAISDNTATDIPWVVTPIPPYATTFLGPEDLGKVEV